MACDERQLPPTDFFTSGSADDEESDGSETDEATIRLTDGYESILDVLTALLPTRSLTWHYRSRDERLIAFSNAAFYDRSLVTFPGVTGGDSLRHVHVPDLPAADEKDTSGAEVRRVADLVLEHARTRPDESLGVITMGIKHADRIAAELLARRREHPALDAFFDESREEKFFVKNLERVQGDERDAIILSIGYGKGPNGRMRYQWGPLNREGGERRLNVAITRAKQRMTLVSSFTAYDVDPDAVRAEGAKVLRNYLEYAASGGARLNAHLAATPELNPFEIDVRDRLSAAGIRVVAQYGVSGYRIDFAASHPDQPGRMVLAIEADGASYHSSHSARDRDRLRQQHLENLGWTFHRIWSTDWFRDPAREVTKVKAAYAAAVAAADEPPIVADARETSRPHGDDSAAASGAQEVPTIASSAEMATAKPSRTSSLHVVPPASSTPSRSEEPPIPVGRSSIADYGSADLRQLVRWVSSDQRLRTDEQVFEEVFAMLGFTRRGGRIRTAITSAIQAERRASRTRRLA